ncbi:MAG TPA: sigma factor-like helix-turn-helix DNA-binding protein [Tepidisphaeraceae bacterium]|nr:sigma factor-like helix-turn-helix DNA-binding protein [Tepidisphaeraceae bacterium]
MSSVTGTAFQANRSYAPADLAGLARLGDRGAYGQIVLLYQDRLYNAMLRLVGDADEAAELTRQTLARGLATVDQIMADSPYEWLFGIGCNLALSLLHRNRRRRPFELNDDEKPVRQRVFSAMGRLEAEYRAVLVMREIESFDYQRIADVLALPLATIKSRLFRARLALRDELREAGSRV